MRAMRVGNRPAHSREGPNYLEAEVKIERGLAGHGNIPARFHDLMADADFAPSAEQWTALGLIRGCAFSPCNGDRAGHCDLM
jgi:hypothetical protein